MRCINILWLWKWLCVYLCVPDQDLSDLDDWPEALQADASQVETRANRQKRKSWWKNIEVPGQALSTAKHCIPQVLPLVRVSIHPSIHLSMNPSIQLLSATYLGLGFRGSSSSSEQRLINPRGFPTGEMFSFISDFAQWNRWNCLVSLWAFVHLNLLYVPLLQIWAKLIYVLVVITIIILLLLVVGGYQCSALQNIVAISFLLFDFSWLFHLCLCQFQFGLLPKRADMLSGGKKNKEKNDLQQLWSADISKLMVHLVSVKQKVDSLIFVPFYFNKGTPGTHKEIQLTPMTINLSATCR